MARWCRSLLIVLMLVLGAGVAATVVAPSVAAQTIDEEVPPGNPVIGSERAGDVEPENGTRYGLWILVAVCLIAAGVLLVKIERWEARRSDQN